MTRKTTRKTVAPRGLGRDGQRLYVELLAVHDPPADRLLVNLACGMADQLARVRRELRRRSTKAARRDRLQRELRQQILVLDRLLSKLGRLTPSPRLEDRERFNIAKRAHAGGHRWIPEEWAAHAGHVPPSVPERFIAARLRAAARPTPDLCPPWPAPKKTDIRRRLRAVDD